jgi:hypothetical protein
VLTPKHPVKLPKSNFIWYSLLNRPVFELTVGAD